MANGGRTSTTLDIRVNARDLNRLDRLLKKTFKPGTARDMNRGFQDTVRTLNKLTRELANVTREMTKQKGSSRVYQDMRKDMEGARKEAEKLRKELDSIKRGNFTRGGGGSPGGGGAGGGGRSGGGGGSAYTGSGQMPMPTPAALTQALGAIPVMGAAMGGTIMASYQMYGSALRHQTAKRDSFAYLGLESDQMMSQSTTRRGTQGHTTIRGGNAAQARQAGVSGLHDEKGLNILERGAEKLAADFFRGYDYLISDTGVTKARDRAIARKSKEAGYDTEYHAATQRQYSHKFGVGGLTGVGVKYGVNSTQALQEASGLSQAMGRRTTADQYDQAKAMQMMFGVDLAQSGSMVAEGSYAFGQSRSGGGGSGSVVGGSMDTVAKMIGQALALGLKGSEIPDYLRGMQGMMKRAADSGQTSGDLGNMMTMQRRLRSSGISGRIANTMTGQFAQGAAKIGMGGSGGAEEFMLMRAMGYTGTGGPEEYAKYKLMLQDESQAVKAMPGYLGQGKGVGGEGSAMETLVTQRLGQAVGMNFHGDAFAQIAGGIAGDHAGARGMVDAMTGKRIVGAAGESSDYAAGLTKTEAVQENQRVQVGYKAAKQVQAFNQIMISLADTAQNVTGQAITDLTAQLQGLALSAQNLTGGNSGSKDTP